MFEFIKEMRKAGKVTNEMLDIYLNIFINQEQYNELKNINIK